MTRGPFTNGHDKDRPSDARDADAPARRLTPTSGAPRSERTPPPPPPPEGPQRVPLRSLVIAIPAEHAVALDRIALPVTHPDAGEPDVIVACAGQPKDIAAIHAHLRTAQFLLAPEETSAEDLRVLAFFQANGDIVSFTTAAPLRTNAFAAAHGSPRGAVRPDISLSVVVPVHNGGRTLAATLVQIRASSLPRGAYELVVVDDASSDGSQAVAARYADTLIRLNGRPRGASYARNRGAEHARADVVVFVDADVGVPEDALSMLLAALDDDAGVAAVSAVNDGTGQRGRFTAEYWNLLHAYGATQHAGADAQFNASCGAVRRRAFVDAGMFNEWFFRQPSVEDVEMGGRLLASGHRVEVQRHVAFVHRAGGGLVGLIAAVWRLSAHATRTLGWRMTRAAARGHVVHTLTSVDFGLFAFWVRRRGALFAIAATPMHVVLQAIATVGLVWGSFLRATVGDPAPDATTQAFAEVGVDMWPPVPRRP